MQETLDFKTITSYPIAELFKLYHSLEAVQQEIPSLPYSSLLTTIHPLLAQKLNLPVPSESQSQAFGSSISNWPAFPDTVSALKRLSKHYKLVVLSNVDRTSFAASNVGPLEDFPFDLIITAEDVGTYRPDARKFEFLLREARERFGIGKGEVLQTAQSQFHDHLPARALGLASCWIVRPEGIIGNVESPVFDWKYDTLGEMADAVEREV